VAIDITLGWLVGYIRGETLLTLDICHLVLHVLCVCEYGSLEEHDTDTYAAVLFFFFSTLLFALKQ
jgi:hypothetical protein